MKIIGHNEVNQTVIIQMPLWQEQALINFAGALKLQEGPLPLTSEDYSFMFRLLQRIATVLECMEQRPGRQDFEISVRRDISIKAMRGTPEE